MDQISEDRNLWKTLADTVKGDDNLVNLILECLEKCLWEYNAGFEPVLPNCHNFFLSWDVFVTRNFHDKQNITSFVWIPKQDVPKRLLHYERSGLLDSYDDDDDEDCNSSQSSSLSRHSNSDTTSEDEDFVGLCPDQENDDIESGSNSKDDAKSDSYDAEFASEVEGLAVSETVDGFVCCICEPVHRFSRTSSNDELRKEMQQHEAEHEEVEKAKAFVILTQEPAPFELIEFVSNEVCAVRVFPMQHLLIRNYLLQHSACFHLQLDIVRKTKRKRKINSS